MFSVSGNNKQRSPAVTEAAPNITNGRAWPNLPPTRSPYNLKKKQGVNLNFVFKHLLNPDSQAPDVLNFSLCEKKFLAP